MSETDVEKKIEGEEENAPRSNSMAAFSPTMDELKDALSLLYIRANASGRNKFREKWPHVSLYLFGETLIQYDNDGTDKLDHRAELEEEADQRRILLKHTISELIDKSVDAGMINFEYVGKVIDTFGGELCRHLYAENVINRVRPGAITPNEQTDNAPPSVPLTQASAPKTTPEEKPLSEEEKALLSNVQPDEMENVKPIETSSSETSGTTSQPTPEEVITSSPIPEELPPTQESQTEIAPIVTETPALSETPIEAPGQTTEIPASQAETLMPQESTPLTPPEDIKPIETQQPSTNEIPKEASEENNVDAGVETKQPIIMPAPIGQAPPSALPMESVKEEPKAERKYAAPKTLEERANDPSHTRLEQKPSIFGSAPKKEGEEKPSIFGSTPKTEPEAEEGKDNKPEKGFLKFAFMSAGLKR